MPRLEDPSTRGADLIDAIDDARRARLERGELEIVELPPKGGKGVGIRALKIVDAPVEKAWPVIRDADRFAEFMPKVGRSDLVERDDDAFVVHLEIPLPFPMKNLTSDIRSVCTDLPGGGHERRWTLVRGTYEKNDGAWTALPWPPGEEHASRTLLAYELDVAPQLRIPDKLLRKAQASGLPDMFGAVEKRIRTLG